MLQQIRDQIDKIDKQLLSLFLQRMDLAKQVGAYKRENNLPVLNPQREQELIAEKLLLLQDKEYEKYTVEFFECLMELSRQLQYQMMPQNECSLPKLTENSRIVYQGTQGSYSEEAMYQYFGEAKQSFHVNTFEEVFQALNNNCADYGVLPVENTSTGSIDDVLDLLAQSNAYIVGEVVVEINHCLMGVEGATIRDIKEIYSHEQGFSQSSEFLKDLPDVKQVPYYNTAISAKFVKEQKDKSKAAIASKRAAQLYSLQILAEGINKKKNNHTRFIIVSNQLEVADNANKVSLAFTVAHRSGSLYNVLSYFAQNNLNLMHIESRPLPDKNFEYLFYVDFAGHLYDEPVKQALELVKKECSFMRILGCIRGELSC